MEQAVVIKSVSKSFGSVNAVKNLDLKVKAGVVYGLLGPNGSGKSTTMKMVMGLLKHDHGKISVYGIDPQRNPIEVKKSWVMCLKARGCTSFSQALNI